MEDCLGSDDEYYYSDQDSLDGIENEDSDPQWIPPKGTTTKVFDFIFFLDFQLFQQSIRVEFQLFYHKF